MTAYCPECGNVICQCEEIKRAERPHLSKGQVAPVVTDLRKAAEMALEALESVYGKGKRCEAAIQALRQALAQPEQEPVAWHEPDSFGNVTTYKKWALENGWKPLYTAPPSIEAAVLAEREACAAICDEIASRHHKQHYPDLESVADECAGAIRSRSEERF